jgi:hypothetical protein
MATYAVMNGNIVSGIILSDNKEETEASLGVTLIEYTTENPAGIGSIYDAANNRFVAPAAVEMSATDKIAASGLSEEQIATLIQEAGNSAVE